MCHGGRGTDPFCLVTTHGTLGGVLNLPRPRLLVCEMGIVVMTAS
jgi:hypothetical protein